MSTNFVAIAGETEDPDIHVQSRGSTGEYHVQDINLETMEEGRQPGVSVHSLLLLCKLQLKGLCFRWARQNEKQSDLGHRRCWTENELSFIGHFLNLRLVDWRFCDHHLLDSHWFVCNFSQTCILSTVTTFWMLNWWRCSSFPEQKSEHFLQRGKMQKDWDKNNLLCAWLRLVCVQHWCSLSLIFVYSHILQIAGGWFNLVIVDIGTAK